MIAVLTAPRRPEYLAATLRDLEICGARDYVGRKVVAVDGPLRVILGLRCVPAGWSIVQVGPGGRGNNREAFSNVCKLAAADGNDLLFFEDDVRGCRHAVTALDLIDVPDDVGFLQAFDHRNMLGDQTVPILLRVEPDAYGGFWGNQALKIPARTVAHLAKQPNDRWVNGVAFDPAQARSLSFGADVWLGIYAASPAAPCLVYGLIAPSLFQHVGGLSSINPHWRMTRDQWRVARNWREDFDGLAVVAAFGQQDRG